MINVDLSDQDRHYVLSLDHSVLDFEELPPDPRADVSLAVSRTVLNSVLAEGASLADLVERGEATAEGSVGALRELDDVLDSFDLSSRSSRPDRRSGETSELLQYPAKASVRTPAVRPRRPALTAFTMAGGPET